MSTTRRAFALAAGLLAASMSGAGVAGAPAQPVPPAPPAWTIDRAASRVSLTLAGPPPVQGVFKRWTAQAAFDPAHPAQAKVALTIEAASLVTGDPARDQALTGAGALAAARAPHITFTTRTITARPGGGFDAAGELSAAGRTRPSSAVLRFSRDAQGRRLDLELQLPPDAFAPPGRARPTAAGLAVRLVARDR